MKVGLRNPGSDWSTRINHDTIVYQYRAWSQRPRIVPVHYTHSVTRCRPIRAPVLTNQSPYMKALDQYEGIKEKEKEQLAHLEQCKQRTKVGERERGGKKTS